MARRKKSPTQRQESEPSQSPRWRLAAAGLAAIAVAAVIGITAALLLAGGGNAPATTGKTAVIVDQLQLTQPNPDFVSNARDVLARAGYTVDYVAGDQVTVDFYRTLPQRNYDLVVLRVHAGITTEVDLQTGQKTGQEYVSLFTGEPYSPDKYPQEQLNRLGKATYFEGADPLFGIGPEFIDKSMEGSFNGSVVVMMGCDGLRSQKTAEAFLHKGASAFVSWSQPVSGPHTDATTERLLEHLLIDNQPIQQAVANTAAELGPDPTYKGELRVLTG
jgi:hypothetical protein